MELVYLWVEDYKNIHQQGFNFSPKFNCHYDGETLILKDNVDDRGEKQYIENFFGYDINVTAIVGKNGSWKSSLLELLLILFYGTNEVNLDKKNKAWLITYDTNKNYFNTHSWIKKTLYTTKL